MSVEFSLDVPDRAHRVRRRAAPLGHQAADLRETSNRLYCSLSFELIGEPGPRCVCIKLCVRPDDQSSVALGQIHADVHDDHLVEPLVVLRLASRGVHLLRDQRLEMMALDMPPHLERPV